ncbi:MAG: acyl-CoA dehydrogenase [Candidatus Nanopelagicales bacterium]|nr:acyl-CoA dehydrogenase [Candidatus Nanopelagicales bacterium]
MTRGLILSQRDLEFLLYEWLDAEALTTRTRYAEHSRETFDAALDLSATVAERHFAPHNKRNDAEEPTFDGERVVMHEEVGEALKVFTDTGLMTAGMPAEVGGMQMPACVTMACFAWFQAANISTAAYPFLTIGNANLLLAHGTQEQIDAYVAPMMQGRYYGTMCLSEPQAGSSLADVAVRAEPQADGNYRLFGNKMWISGGDHELTENIIHLVLARVPGSPAGVKGLSLFIVPKYLVDSGERNDVTLAGLNHKMGYRGTTNTLLNFGEGRHQPDGRPGAVGYLVGEQNRGLAYMFHMMNEARVGVGVGAVALGYTGYLHALDYARTRLQGRPLRDRDPNSPQIPIIEHTDVRRMLLAQKSYVEGGMALSLFCAHLFDQQLTADDEQTSADLGLLLDVLTPIAKSWPSQWCLEANALAIQVHGGYGYTRDYDVEQFYRDNRLNPIHEGTHGIQALDLLGRKVIAADGAGLRLLLARIEQTCERAEPDMDLRDQAQALRAAAGRLAQTTMTVWGSMDPDLALANATIYLEAFGHVVVAWLWLEQMLAAAGKTGAFYDGKRAAGRYFFAYELPRTTAQFDLLGQLDRTVLDLDSGWL